MRSQLCDWWEWSWGSTLFFWRWPIKYRRQARDGTKLWFETAFEAWTQAQPAESDLAIRSKMKEKLAKVVDHRYMEFGFVVSLTRFFAVPKGEDDIWMVYDALISGLNDVIWTPSFMLPMIDSLLRAVTHDTWMTDLDVGEMFLNFLLEETVHKFAGVDLIRYFPELLEDEGPLWLRWARCVIGLTSLPFQCIQGILWAKEVIRGNRRDPDNIFRWDVVHLNLPFTPGYNPSKSWITKIRLSNGLVACDSIIFVDDIRTTGNSKWESWLAAHVVGSKMQYLGMQEAPRKRRATSQMGGAWAGGIVHVVP